MNIFKICASLAWLLLTIGLLKRKRKNLHIRLMLSGIAIDVVIVATLQITKNAIKTASEFKLSLLSQLHIFSSTTALILYPFVIYFGIKLYKGSQSHRSLHKKIAITCYTFRTLGFFFMFWV